MTNHEIKFAVIYKALRPKAEYFKWLAIEGEVDQPRALVEAALMELSAKLIINQGANQATQREASLICSAVVAKLIEDLFPMACR